MADKKSSSDTEVETKTTTKHHEKKDENILEKTAHTIRDKAHELAEDVKEKAHHLTHGSDSKKNHSNIKTTTHSSKIEKKDSGDSLVRLSLFHRYRFFLSRKFINRGERHRN